MPDILSAKDLRDRYKICAMTLWRWRRDPELNFPQPIKWRNRARWRAADIEAFEASQKAQ
jgi:predicted DNA-binding transcriptional regulator AlpA